MQAEFLSGATRPEHFPQSDLPEIAFAGRSNVGKSSLLNALLGRRNLAHTSSTPGKTRQINFFRIENKWVFVDLPGYGYAKVSKTEREDWRRNIERYLLNRQQLRLVVSLIDIRHEPTALDRSMLDWLEDVRQPHIVVLTKSDKIKKGQIEKRVQELHGLTSGSNHLLAIEPFSVNERERRQKLYNRIVAIADQL